MSDRKLTREEVDKVFIAAFGFPAREADHAVLDLMGGTIETLAEYIWDHWMGEPENPTPDTIEAEIVRIIEPEVKS